MKIDKFKIGDMIEDSCGNILIIKSFKTKSLAEIVQIKIGDRVLDDYNGVDITDSNIHLIDINSDFVGDDWTFIMSTIGYQNEKKIVDKISEIDQTILDLKIMQRGLDYLRNFKSKEKSMKIVNNLKTHEMYEIDGELMIYLNFEDGVYNFMHSGYDGNFLPFEFDELCGKKIVHKNDLESKNAAKMIIKFFDI